jgi:hypothetical protein
MPAQQNTQYRDRRRCVNANRPRQNGNLTRHCSDFTSQRSYSSLDHRKPVFDVLEPIFNPVEPILHVVEPPFNGGQAIFDTAETVLISGQFLRSGDSVVFRHPRGLDA